MNKKLSVIVTLFLLLLSFSLSGCNEDTNYSLEVNGGTVIKESDSSIVIRSYSSETEIHVKGFDGDIVVTNCNRNSEIEGIDNGYEIQNTNVSIEIDGEESFSITAQNKSEFKFAIIGDTQGMDHIFKDAVKDMEDIEFLIHCGDITPSGKKGEYDRAQQVMNSTDFPIYTTPGNHDVRSDGRDTYNHRFAPLQYSFNYSNYNFVFLDSSELSITQEQIDWMESRIYQDKSNVIITHAPYFDPFGGSHTVDEESSDMIFKFISENKVDYFISGHIHSFFQDTSEQTKRLITGGGGGSLVEGEHHYVSAEADEEGIGFTKVPIDTDEQNIYEIVVMKGDKNITYTYQGLLYSTDEEGVSSFQNQFGNVRGEGYYEGVKTSTLLEAVGGMVEEDILVVRSIDGYEQKFGYLNVYPNEEYMGLQGDMILALKYNNQTIDGWEDGPRIVMLPEDGYYSNDDCAKTSYEGQGWNVYESAGARWVKYVKEIRVIEGG